MQLISFESWPLWGVILLFLGAAAVITVAGTRLTRVADRLADVSGLGEAIFGAVLLGGSTSLPGIVTSVATAYEGYAELAISNAIGGIAVQTTFLAIADMTYRKANLEHAAASVENLMQGALLMTLLAIPLLASSAPPVSFIGIHPASLALLAAYILGIRSSRRLARRRSGTRAKRRKPNSTLLTKTSSHPIRRCCGSRSAGSRLPSPWPDTL